QDRTLDLGQRQLVDRLVQCRVVCLFLQRQSPPFKLTAMIRALRCNRNRREPPCTAPAAILCKDRADFRHSGLLVAVLSSSVSAEILRQFCRPRAAPPSSDNAAASLTRTLAATGCCR